MAGGFCVPAPRLQYAPSTTERKAVLFRSGCDEPDQVVLAPSVKRLDALLRAPNIRPWAAVSPATASTVVLSALEHQCWAAYVDPALTHSHKTFNRTAEQCLGMRCVRGDVLVYRAAGDVTLPELKRLVFTGACDLHRFGDRVQWTTCDFCQFTSTRPLQTAREFHLCAVCHAAFDPSVDGASQADKRRLEAWASCDWEDQEDDDEDDDGHKRKRQQSDDEDYDVDELKWLVSSRRLPKRSRLLDSASDD